MPNDIKYRPTTENPYAAYRAKYEKRIPKPFLEFLSSQAWNRGHAYGQTEVDLIFCDMAFELEKAIEKYRDWENL